MKRKICLAAVATVLGIAPIATVAQSIPDGTYLRGFGGATSEVGGDSFDGISAGVALGMRTEATSPWRFELEAVRRSQNSANGIEGATSLMANALVDFAEIGSSTAYIGAGLGAMQIAESAGGISDKQIQPVGQAILGVGIPLSRTTDLTLETRYINAGDLPVSGDDAELIDFSVGIAFSF